MRRSADRSLTFALALACLVAAGFSPAALAGKKAPPILDRELFFGDPEISQAQISPDGRFISFVKPLDGTRNVWIKGIDEPFDEARPLTADTKRPIPGYFWSRDSRLVLFVQDRDGDENYNVYAVDPTAKPAQGRQVPDARNLTELEGGRAQIYAVPRTTPDIVYVGLNDRDQAWHDLYRLQLSTGERTLVRENTERIASWFFDLAGQLRLALRIAEDGTTEILTVAEKGFSPVYSCSVFESCAPVRYHKDGQRVFMVTNKGDDVDLTRLVLFDPRTGGEELIESDPLKRVDFGTPIFSEVTDELLATVYEDSRLRIYWRDKSFEADHERLTKQLGGKELLPGSSTADERLWLLTATSDVEPGERYLFDRESKKFTLQYRVFEKLPRQHLAPMEAVSYPSSDGLEIPAFLTLPRGVAPEKLPVIIFPHGGPWARDGWGYDSLAQFLANRGYGVLQPNFRGSTGYGKKFLNAGNLEWGLAMQDDLTWGAKYLVQRGIADPKRVGIMGGSYGGYATLAGVTFTPDTYAAAVSIVGPSNLITLLDSIPPYWEAIRTIFHHRMGDPTTPEGRALLERASPLNSAAKIRTPLLVVQGANDPRVKQRESDQIVIALRDRKFPVEYLVADDEGHGFAKPVNNLALFAAAEKFLAKHLGGRYQEQLPAETATRLSELTVDVATVKLAETVDVAAVGLPQPVSPLVAGTYNYQTTIEAGGQTIDVTIVREVEEDGDRWAVTETVESPMGGGEDRSWLERGTLVMLSRKISQGPVTIQIEIQDHKASGTMSVGGQERLIDVTLAGDLFGDGPGSSEALATLPLAEGFTAIYRNLDLMAQKEKLMKLVVGAIETVTVPAGTFEAWRLDIAPADGDPGRSSVWIARDSRTVVKTTAVVPEMGGATVTSVLVP